MQYLLPDRHDSIRKKFWKKIYAVTITHSDSVILLKWTVNRLFMYINGLQTAKYLSMLTILRAASVMATVESLITVVNVQRYVYCRSSFWKKQLLATSTVNDRSRSLIAKVIRVVRWLVLLLYLMRTVRCTPLIIRDKNPSNESITRASICNHKTKEQF